MYTTNLIACDGIQFPTDHSNDPFLVYCDFDGGFDMVPWTHLREPFLRWMLTDWTSELAHFNLVIRLSKAKQSAIPLTTFFMTSRRSCRPCEPWDNFQSAQVKLHGTATNFLIPTQRQNNCKDPWKVSGSCLQVWSTFFWLFSGEVEHIVHLNHLIRLNSNSFLSPCGSTDYRPLEGVTHDFLGQNRFHLINCCCFFAFHQPVPHSVPYFMRSSLPR